MGGINTKVIERNTTIPTKKSQIFSTAVDNQPSVEVHVLQGEREFAKDNKTLGVFSLDGIMPARRGVPQIEVTFDIDANGIVHVSAKDLGTGKEQSISITSSTNMSKEDIEKAVREAEQFAQEDKKRREDVDTRNEADQMVYQCEKILSEEGAQNLPEEDKAEIQSKIDSLKNALQGEDINLIKNEKEALTQSFYKLSEKLYQQTQGAQQAGGFNPNDFAGGFNPNDFAGAQNGYADGTAGADGYSDAGYTDANFTDAN